MGFKMLLLQYLVIWQDFLNKNNLKILTKKKKITHTYPHLHTKKTFNDLMKKYLNAFKESL